MTDVRKGPGNKPLPKTHTVRKDNTLRNHTETKQEQFTPPERTASALNIRPN